MMKAFCILRSGTWAFSLIVFASLSSNSDAQTSVEELLSLLSQSNPKEIVYKESQVNPLLEEAQESFGTLAYNPSERVLVKTTFEPNTISFSMTEEQMTVLRDGKTRTISMQRTPELRALFHCIRGLIEGNQAEIQRYFSIAFTPMENNLWMMMLTPIDTSMVKRLTSIEIWGTDAEIDTISTVSSNGNIQVMYLNHGEALEKYEAARLKQGDTYQNQAPQ